MYVYINIFLKFFLHKTLADAIKNAVSCKTLHLRAFSNDTVTVQFNQSSCSFRQITLRTKNVKQKKNVLQCRANVGSKHAKLCRFFFFVYLSKSCYCPWFCGSEFCLCSVCKHNEIALILKLRCIYVHRQEKNLYFPHSMVEIKLINQVVFTLQLP